MEFKQCICQVYKSKRQQGLYIYVDKTQGTSCLPDTLISRLGELEEVLVFSLHANKQLAVANPVEVLAKINEQGFYIQLPTEQSFLDNIQWHDDML